MAIVPMVPPQVIQHIARSTQRAERRKDLTSMTMRDILEIERERTKRAAIIEKERTKRAQAMATYAAASARRAELLLALARERQLASEQRAIAKEQREHLERLRAEEAELAERRLQDLEDDAEGDVLREGELR